ncbi:hypothetical protein GF337_04475 [candidate division KSB1 bacterium]|nr:hypothetical protein [candidate division KSB1 bacterium]
MKRRINRNFGLVLYLAICISMISCGTKEQGVRFPKNKSIVDVTQEPYYAKGDGKTDDTAALQRAIMENVGKIIYIPKGEYLISSTLKWAAPWRNVTLWGEHRDETVIKLADRCEGFEDSEQPKAVIWTGASSAQRFKNYIRNLTINTGKGNPAAIGIQFMANNTGAVREVSILSGDKAGVIGLDLGFTSQIGPCLIKDIKIIGFDIGVNCKNEQQNIIIENLFLRDQNRIGIVNEGQSLLIRQLKSKNDLTVLLNSGAASCVVIDSKIIGEGNANRKKAIVNKSPAVLFVRNTAITDYKVAIENESEHGRSLNDVFVEEYVSHEITQLFQSPGKSLNLNIAETPSVPWGDVENDWVNVEEFKLPENDEPAPDDAFMIQRAIDSGAKTIYFPVKQYHIKNDITIQNNVQRLIGMGTYTEILGKGKFVFAEGNPPVVVIENISGTGSGIVHGATRTLVLRNMTIQAPGQMASYKGANIGSLFIEDVSGISFEFGRGDVWIRQLHLESANAKIFNRSANVSILGLTIEHQETLFQTENDARSELLGGYIKAVSSNNEKSLFIHQNGSSVSLNFMILKQDGKRASSSPLIEETRNEKVELLRVDELTATPGGFVMPLFVGYH